MVRSWSVRTGLENFDGPDLNLKGSLQHYPVVGRWSMIKKGQNFIHVVNERPLVRQHDHQPGCREVGRLRLQQPMGC